MGRCDAELRWPWAVASSYLHQRMALVQAWICNLDVRLECQGRSLARIVRLSPSQRNVLIPGGRASAERCVHVIFEGPLHRKFQQWVALTDLAIRNSVRAS